MKNLLSVGTQRTGRNARRGGISLHPGVVCSGESALRMPSWRAIRTGEAGASGRCDGLVEADQDHMDRSVVTDSKPLGFRRFFPSSNKLLFRPRFLPAVLLDGLEARQTWRHGKPEIGVISIVREANLAWLTSKAISRELGAWFRQPYQDGMAVRIDAGEPLRRVTADKNWRDGRLATLKQSNPYRRGCNEDFRQDNRTVLNELLPFPGVDTELPPASEVHMNAKPQSRKIARGSVENCGEPEAALLEQGLLCSQIP